MDGRNCSSITGFIFLGITDNTKDKVTIFTMVLIVYLIGHLANLGMIFLIRMDPQMHTPVYFFLGHLSFCVLCYSTAIHPKMIMDLICQEQSNPLLWLLLCDSRSSVCFQILSVSCWPWWPMTGTRPSAAPCSMQSACPAGCAPCLRLGFTWWEWQMLWYTWH